MNATLIREKLPVTEVTACDSFFAKCEDELGYKEAVNQAERIKSKAIVAKVFDKLAFAPLKTESVEKYQYDVAWTIWDSIGVGILCFIGLSASATGVLGILYLLDIVAGSWAGFAALFGILVPIVGTFISMMMFGDLITTKSWRKTSLRNYDGEVPRFALQTALEIKEGLKKESCYDPEFYVEWLSVGTVRSLDPFLAMRVGEDRYYLEVWNEPGFDVQREI